jgi:hypothetical protein
LSLLKTVLGEVLGLFLDDGRLAGAILVWLVAAYVVLPRLAVSSGAAAFVLSIGLAAILVESVLNHAHARRR